VVVHRFFLIVVHQLVTFRSQVLMCLTTLVTPDDMPIHVIHFFTGLGIL